jgi:hypothetical protein
VEQAGKPVHKRIIDNAATSLVEQAGKPVHKRIIDNAATSHIAPFSKTGKMPVPQ